jgi:hypothetical protein
LTRTPFGLNSAAQALVIDDSAGHLPVGRTGGYDA